MTHSMTGYGKETCQFEGRLITVEIRCLNSKQADLNVRMPSAYREKEMEMREILAANLVRGKIDLNIQRDLADDELGISLNPKLVKSYYHVIKSLENEMNEQAADNATAYLDLVLRMPDILRPVTENLDPLEFNLVIDSVKKCVENVQSFRKEEGSKLESVLRESVHCISKLLSTVDPLEKERIDRIRKKISGSLKEDLGEMVSIDQDRFEQEMIFYLEKLDVSEEKVRLKTHCEYFLNTLDGDVIKGKKLGFIAQEIGREINTLGSKAQHSQIQKIVVEMKDELEKIKEQSLNIL